MGRTRLHGDKKLAYALKRAYKAQWPEQQGRICILLDVEELSSLNAKLGDLA